MARESLAAPSALLAFGTKVSPGDAFRGLLGRRGWQAEGWVPTFVEEGANTSPVGTSAPHRALSDAEVLREAKQVLRLPGNTFEERAEASPKLMVASACGLPTLYFVEWHYIDFVLSCVGNISEAARFLGVRRSSVQRKRKKLPPTR